MAALTATYKVGKQAASTSRRMKGHWLLAMNPSPCDKWLFTTRVGDVATGRPIHKTTRVKYLS